MTPHTLLLLMGSAWAQDLSNEPGDLGSDSPIALADEGGAEGGGSGEASGSGEAEPQKGEAKKEDGKKGQAKKKKKKGSKKEGSENESDPPASINVNEAVTAKPLTEEQHEFLKPTRERLPQNPYAATDFTAYTLEWGELKLGLATITVGVLPNTQLGTIPALDALQVPNANAKFNFVSAGPFDAAFTGSYLRSRISTLTAWSGTAGGLASVQILKPWSLHVGATYNFIGIAGAPPHFSDIPDWMAMGCYAPGSDELTPSCRTYEDWVTNVADPNTILLDVKGRAWTLRAATDYRFNRRDSFVLQFQGLAFAGYTQGVSSDAQLPPIAGLGGTVNAGVSTSEDMTFQLFENYMATAAYQASWRHLDLRVGLGWSAPSPYLRPLQAFDLSWRFGGKTRQEENQIRKGWRKDGKNIGK
jgi:hypothetical protein